LVLVWSWCGGGGGGGSNCWFWFWCSGGSSVGHLRRAPNTSAAAAAADVHGGARSCEIDLQQQAQIRNMPFSRACVNK
jgi:hypothetical protein